MKKKLNSIMDFIVEVILIYSMFVMIMIAIDFLCEMPIVCVPLLILAFLFKVIPMVRKKKERD